MKEILFKTSGNTETGCFIVFDETIRSDQVYNSIYEIRKARKHGLIKRFYGSPLTLNENFNKFILLNIIKEKYKYVFQYIFSVNGELSLIYKEEPIITNSRER